MPYIITTGLLPQYQGTGATNPTATRHAVATLEEVLDYIGTMTDDDAHWNELCRSLPEDGGTVGPLPDGSMIEAERLPWADLRERSGYGRDDLVLDRVVIDAFNA